MFVISLVPQESDKLSDHGFDRGSDEESNKQRKRDPDLKSKDAPKSENNSGEDKVSDSEYMNNEEAFS